MQGWIENFASRGAIGTDQNGDQYPGRGPVRPSIGFFFVTAISGRPLSKLRSLYNLKFLIFQHTREQAHGTA